MTELSCSDRRGTGRVTAGLRQNPMPEHHCLCRKLVTTGPPMPALHYLLANAPLSMAHSHAGRRTGLDGMGSAASLDLVIRGWSIPLCPDLLPEPIPDPSLCLSPWLGKTNEREAGADPNGPQPRSCRQPCCK
ncbi:hypothetical protein AOLI_G00006340 [Acnodon oligacanthus]